MDCGCGKFFGGGGNITVAPSPAGTSNNATVITPSNVNSGQSGIAPAQVPVVRGII